MKFLRTPLLWTISLAICAALLAACFASGPQKTLNQLAQALQKKDVDAFLPLLDLQALASNDIKNLTQENQTLNAMDSLGRELGLGSVDSLLGGLLGDRAGDLAKSFAEGVASGALEDQCRASTDSRCPWVAASLEKAEVKDVSKDAAVAKVVTPAGGVSWLALQQRANTWVVVGRSGSEKMATAFALALDTPAAPAKDNTKDAAKPEEQATPAPAQPEQGSGKGVTI
ncbi:MAG: hypothetical protein IJA79_02015 [Desulfovibrio sp.]|nr:hypothetical protein [Desulfovibrio sp.]